MLILKTLSLEPLHLSAARTASTFRVKYSIGYAFTAMASLGSWPLLRFVLGIENPAITLAIMISVAVFFGIWFVRYSKVLLIALDLTLRPPAAEGTGLFTKSSTSESVSHDATRSGGVLVGYSYQFNRGLASKPTMDTHSTRSTTIHSLRRRR